MRKLTVGFYSLFLLVGCDCNKPPTIIPEDLLVKVLTEGEWSITNFTMNSTNYTQDYAGWRVKFHSNKTADAKFNAAVVYTGTWDGSQSTMTFTCNFPGATLPISRVIGTWNVIPSGSRIVDGTQTVGTDVKTMKLYRE